MKKRRKICASLVGAHFYWYCPSSAVPGEAADTAIYIRGLFIMPFKY
jgi:hypothetical protein